MFSSFKGFLVVIAYVVAFVWIEDDEHLDAVVGISIRHKPVCTGVFIKWDVILTSANPLEKLWVTEGKHIRVSQVIYSYDRNHTYAAHQVGFNISNRTGRWVTVGNRTTNHSTIHDLMLILTNEPKLDIMLNITVWHLRRKFFTPMATMRSYYSPEDVWYFAGFGFVDEKHVKENSFLEVEYLNARTRVDCDEWIPREWGCFLCFYDFNNLAGVASGAPLFHGSNFIPGLSPVYGVGAFSLTKGKETILVFTDIRAYYRKIHPVGWAEYDGGQSEPFLPYITNVGPILPGFDPPYRKQSSDRQ